MLKLSERSNALDLHPKRCEQCGKKFECSVQHVYKRYKPKSRKAFVYFCSYSCLRAYDREHEKKRA